MDYRFLILSLLTILVATTKFSISIQPYEKTCFYEILNNMIEGKWNAVYFKQTKSAFEAINVHKLAAA